MRIVHFVMLCAALLLVGACGPGAGPRQGMNVLCLHSVEARAKTFGTEKGALEHTAAHFAEEMLRYRDPTNLVYEARAAADARSRMVFHKEMVREGAALVGFVQLPFDMVVTESGAGKVRVRLELMPRVVDHRGRQLFTTVIRVEESDPYKAGNRRREDVVARLQRQALDRTIDEAARRICENFNKREKKEK